MTPLSATVLAQAESVPDGSTVVWITAIGLAIIVMLILVLGRRYRRMAVGDRKRKRRAGGSDTADAWTESARRMQMSDGEADG